MTELQKITDNIEGHIKSISEMNRDQLNLVNELIVKNEKDIEAYQAFASAEKINEKVTEMIRVVTDELDAAVKNIMENIK